LLNAYHLECFSLHQIEISEGRFYALGIASLCVWPKAKTGLKRKEKKAGVQNEIGRKLKGGKTLSEHTPDERDHIT